MKYLKLFKIHSDYEEYINGEAVINRGILVSAYGEVYGIDIYKSLRTKEGIETARLNGKQIGQQFGRRLIIKKEKPAKENILKYSRDFNGTLSDSDCIKLIGISRNTFYKYKRELKSMYYMIEH